MIIKQVEIREYESGDILDISEVKVQNRKPALNRARFALVLAICGQTYKVLTDTNAVSFIKQIELGNEKYLSHVDMSNWKNVINGEATT